jgi:MFS family permease
MVDSLALPSISKRPARISISVFFFLAGFCFSSWVSRIPDIKQHLGLNYAGLGGVLLALPVGLFISLPFSGWCVARFGSRRMATISAILYACILCVLGLVKAPWQLAGTLFFFGLAGNLMNISINTQAVSLEAVYGRSIMASFHGVWSLAGFAGGSIGTALIGFHLSPFLHFMIISSTVLIAIVMMNRYLLQQDVNAGTKNPLFAKPDSALLKLGIIALCCMICEGTMFDWSGVYFQKVVQPRKELITVGYNAFMFTMAGGRFIGDWLATKMGSRRILQVSGLVIAAGLILSITLPYFVTATIGFLLVGLGVSSVVPLVYRTAGQSTKFSPGVALAAVSTIGYIGFLAGPPLIGFIAQAASLRWSLALIALLGFMTTVITTAIKKI